MRRHGNLSGIIGLGLVAEVLVFVTVALRIGLGSTILLTILISLIGAMLLRRAGSAALAGVRSMAGGPPRSGSTVIDDTLGALGAALLVVPGFLTDLAGLALLTPWGRRWVARRFGIAMAGQARPARTREAVIDLGVDDWTRLDGMHRR